MPPAFVARARNTGRLPRPHGSTIKQMVELVWAGIASDQNRPSIQNDSGQSIGLADYSYGKLSVWQADRGG
jgi:hypothetical protein